MRLQQHAVNSLGCSSAAQLLPAPPPLAAQQHGRCFQRPSQAAWPATAPAVQHTGSCSTALLQARAANRLQPPAVCYSSKHPAAHAAAAAPAQELADEHTTPAAEPAAEAPLPEVLQRMRQACGLQIPAGHELVEEGSGIYLGMPIRWRTCIQVCCWSSFRDQGCCLSHVTSAMTQQNQQSEASQDCFCRRGCSVHFSKLVPCAVICAGKRRFPRRVCISGDGAPQRLRRQIARGVGGELLIFALKKWGTGGFGRVSLQTG